jgi:hypothetical protein
VLISNTFIAWLSRLLATPVVLAMTLAHVAGSYAHAVGVHESFTRAVYAETHSDGAATGEAVAAVAHDRTSCAQGGCLACDGPENAPDCCDTLGGGYAILAAAPVVPHPRLNAPATELVFARNGVDTASLDRPPRALPDRA